MRPQDIVLFLRFKRGQKGSIVLDLKDKPAKYKSGNVIKAQGSWKKMSCYKKLHTILGNLHARVGHEDHYTVACVDCLSPLISSCSHHVGNSNWFARENVAYSDAYQEEFTLLQREKADEKLKTANFLYPHEILKVGEHLTGNIKNESPKRN